MVGDGQGGFELTCRGPLAVAGVQCGHPRAMAGDGYGKAHTNVQAAAQQSDSPRPGGAHDGADGESRMSVVRRNLVLGIRRVDRFIEG